MPKSRRFSGLLGLLSICAVVIHSIKFVSLDGAFFIRI
jgi:hypothetical protein